MRLAVGSKSCWNTPGAEGWFVCKNCGKEQAGEPVLELTVGKVVVKLGPCCAPPESPVVQAYLDCGLSRSRAPLPPPPLPGSE